jgi:hypothetical protein
MKWILSAIMVGLFGNLLFGGHDQVVVLDDDLDCDYDNGDCYDDDVGEDEAN